MAAAADENVCGIPPRPTLLVWAGRALSGLAILALAVDATGKLFVPELMIANSPPLGLPSVIGSTVRSV